MNKQELIKQLKKASPKPYIKFTKPTREKPKKRKLMINLTENNLKLSDLLLKSS